jgi:hypothetical protein
MTLPAGPDPVNGPHTALAPPLRLGAVPEAAGSDGPADSGPRYTWPVRAIVASLWVYLATLVTAAVAPRYLAAGGTRQLLLLPLLSTLLVVSIIHWIYRASDAAIRHRILKCTALTGVILAFSTLGWFCLERLGYPPLSMIVVNLYGWSLFTLLILGVLYRAR